MIIMSKEILLGLILNQVKNQMNIQNSSNKRHTELAVCITFKKPKLVCSVQFSLDWELVSYKLDFCPHCLEQTNYTDIPG